MKHLLLLGVLFVALALPAFGQTPPANDDFTNRTLLTGNSVAFSGTLAGATMEPNEAAGGFISNNLTETQSVWWTWKATKTSLVTIEMTGASQGQRDRYLQRRNGYIQYNEPQQEIDPGGRVRPGPLVPL